MTLAGDFFSDPRIEEAKRLLCEALRDHQAAMVGVQPADPKRIQTYDQALKHFAQQRGGSLFYRYLGSGFGHGPLVELDDGSVKFDMIGGIGVHGMGHGDERLVVAGIDAAVRDTVMQGNLQQNVESASLVDQLIGLAQPSNLKHCFLTTSGAMANENALKLAFHKHGSSSRLLAFEHCFAGRSMTLAYVTDKEVYRVGLPKTIQVDYVPFYNGSNTDQVVAAIEQHIQAHSGDHAAMMLELIQGENGYYPGDRDFFIAIIDVLHRHNIAVIVDEIQTFGRTEELFAFKHFELGDHVDIVTVGKITQVCATLFSDAYQPKPGLISQTFTGSTSAIFAAGVVLDQLRECRGRIVSGAGYFRGQLEHIAQRHPDCLRGPWGYGSMLAMTVFDGSPEMTKNTLHHLFDRGLIAFLAGSGPMRLRMLPPLLVMNDAQIGRVCDILETTLCEIAAEGNE